MNYSVDSDNVLTSNISNSAGQIIFIFVYDIAFIDKFLLTSEHLLEGLYWCDFNDADVR